MSCWWDKFFLKGNKLETDDCGQVVETLPRNAEEAGTIPIQGTKIPHALWPKKKKTKHKTKTMLWQIQLRICRFAWVMNYENPAVVLKQTE